MGNSPQDVLGIGLTLFLAVILGLGARRLRLPAVIGYLVAGVVVSPFTPGFVANRHQLELLANLGVVLLLFEVGLEIDPVGLGRERSDIVWTAAAQTVISFGLAMFGLSVAGLSTKAAMLVGLAIALSSSIVVVNITRSRSRATNDATNQALLGWSLVQDVTGVVIAAVLLAVARPQAQSSWLALLEFAAYVVLAVGASRLLPKLLKLVRGERDLFLLMTVGVALLLAGLGGHAFGVPLALAAFIAGLAISESPDTVMARRRILPLREVFAVLFFVALGTLIQPSRILPAVPWIAFLALLLVICKAAVTYVLARALNPDVSRPQMAIGLGQVGEFSFVLITIALSRGLVSETVYTAMLSLLVLSIAGSTVLVRLPLTAPFPLSAPQRRRS